MKNNIGILVLILILNSCIDVGQKECEKYFLTLSKKDFKFKLSGKHKFKLISFTDKHGFTLEEYKHDSLAKEFYFKGDFEKLTKLNKTDTLYFKVITVGSKNNIKRDFTGFLTKQRKKTNQKLCPNRR